MTIRHHKYSGEANTDPDLIGGEDWDEDHRLGAGTILPVSATSLAWDSGSSTLSTVARTKGTSTATRQSAGVYTFNFNDGGQAVLSGLAKSFTAILSVSPRGSWPSGWRAEVSQSSYVATVRVFDDTNAETDPPLSVDFTVMVFMSVAAAS